MKQDQGAQNALILVTIVVIVPTDLIAKCARSVVITLIDVTSTTRNHRHLATDRQPTATTTMAGTILSATTTGTTTAVEVTTTAVEVTTTTEDRWAATSSGRDRTQVPSSSSNISQVSHVRVLTTELKGKELITELDECIIVDTGATHHCVNNKNYFDHLITNKKKISTKIQFADGTQRSDLIIGIGTANIPVYDVTGTLRSIQLRDALYIPSFPKHILSLRKAVINHSTFNFNDIGKEYMQTSDGHIFRITSSENLYTLQTIKLNTVVARSVNTWHQILGHANMDYIHKMPTVIDQMHITKGKVKQICQPCIQAKMERSFNKTLDSRAEKPFYRIYCDLAVLTDSEMMSDDDYNYVFGAIDDHSGYLAVYLLKSKSETPQALKKFLADHAHFGNIKIIRSDHGTEFTSQAFQEILLDRCIKSEMSAKYSPHQNARIERAWKSLFNMSRAIQFDSKVPTNLREYIIKYATYLINRSYSEPIKMTPFEAVTKMKPNANTLQLFGSLVYGYQHHVHKRKWDPRALPGVFIGYDTKSPGKLIYFPQDNIIRNVKDVKFTDQLYYETVNSANK